jgi:hypothetical protein
MDPITLGIGAALTGGGMLANMFGSNAAERARQNVINNQNIAQALLAAQANAVNAQSLGRYNNFAEGADTRGRQLGDVLVSAGQPTSYAPGTGNTTNMPVSSSAPTTAATTTANAKGQGYVNQQGASLGQVQGFGDYLGDISRAQVRDADQLRLIRDAQAGDQRLEGLQLDSASQAGSGLRTLGSIGEGLGRIGISGGLTGGLPFSSISGIPSRIAGMFGNIPISAMTPAQQLAAGVIPV